MRRSQRYAGSAGVTSSRFAVLLGTLASLMATAVFFTFPAHAADRIYWSNEPANKLSFANLDGTGGSDLAIVGTTVSGPEGVAIDSAAGRIYWANYGGLNGYTISSANLDGIGGVDINTSGATVSSPYGLAVDPAGGRVYWANASGGPDDISFARIDGSGGGDLNTSGATELDNPLGVAVDTGAGKIYWANYGADKISFANLEGTGGGADLNTTGATVSGPAGIAVDSAAGRIYWANYGGDKISFANLDGSGGEDLNTAGATVNGPLGVAIDPVAGRVYWGNSTGTISYANRNGSGGEDMNTAGASPGDASFPALLKAPSGAGSPAITVAPARGSLLSCSQGTWAPDLLGSFLYRAPRSFAYSWSRNGVDIAGASESSFAPSAVGSYTCTVTGSNDAGSTAQTSSPTDIEIAALRKYAIRPRSFQAAAGGPSAKASGGKKRKKLGARVSFRLNEGAVVTFKVKQRRHDRRARRTRFVALRGGFRRMGQAGKNSFWFTGRLRKKKLKPGRYLLLATPTGVGKAGRTRSADFRIKSP